MSVQLGMMVSQGFQFIEHDGYVPRHADLIGLGLPHSILDGKGQGSATEWSEPYSGLPTVCMKPMGWLHIFIDFGQLARTNETPKFYL
jgi:hypothetical protein